MESFCISQGAPLSARWKPRGVGRGGEVGGDVCTHTADSRCYTAETSTILWSNYTPMEEETRTVKAPGPSGYCRSRRIPCQCPLSDTWLASFCHSLSLPHLPLLLRENLLSVLHQGQHVPLHSQSFETFKLPLPTESVLYWRDFWHP